MLTVVVPSWPNLNMTLVHFNWHKFANKCTLITLGYLQLDLDTGENCVNFFAAIGKNCDSLQ